MCHVRHPAEENGRGELTMKKGDLFEGIVDVIEFPNKGLLLLERMEALLSGRAALNI